MSFAIVSFQGEKSGEGESIELVPTIWITEGEIAIDQPVVCLYPRNQTTARSMVMKQTKLNLLNAECYNAIVKGVYDEYDEGRKKLEKYCYTSNVDTSDDDSRRKTNNRQSDFVYDSSDLEETFLPAPPKKKRDNSHANERHSHISKAVIRKSPRLIKSDNSHANEPQGQILKKLLRKSPRLAKSDSYKKFHPSLASTQVTPRTLLSKSPRVLVREESPETLPNTLMVQESQRYDEGSQMSRDIKEIKFLLKDMVRSVAFLTSIATGRSNDTTMSDQIPSDFRFPLNSLQELHDLEVLLQDASAVRNLSSYFHSKKQKTMRVTCILLLRHIFSNDLAARICWSGSKDKPALKDSAKLVEVLVESCRVHGDTDKEILEIIKNWLRNAKKRSTPSSGGAS